MSNNLTNHEDILFYYDRPHEPEHGSLQEGVVSFKNSYLLRNLC